MKGFFLPLLALAVLFSGLFALLQGSDAEAATNYDDVVLSHDPTSSIYLHYYSNSHNFTDNLDLGQQLGDYTVDDFYNANYGYCGSINQQQNSPQMAYDAIQRIAEGYPYVVYVNQTSLIQTEYNPLRIAVLKDKSSSFTVAHYDYGTENDYLSLESSTAFDSFGFYPRGSSLAICEWDSEAPVYSASFGSKTSTGDYNYVKIIESSKSLIFEDGYEGYEPTPTDEPEKELRRPQFVYQLSDKAIKATPYSPDPELPDFSTELDEGYTFNGYFIGWNLWKCPDNGFDPVGQVCDGGTPALTDDQLLPVDQEYNYSVTEYGTYQVEAEYWVQQCYRYPSYPATPDYCFYSQLRAHFPDADYDFVNTYIILTVDGTSTTGDTKQLECNEGGFCQPASAICYELDSFIDRLNCQMAGQLSVGLLNPSINAVKKLINGVVVPSSPTCNIPLGNITVVGQTIPLSEAGPKMCSSAQQVRNGFPVIPIVVNAMFALAILSFVINRINRLLDNQKHDVLEKI